MNAILQSNRLYLLEFEHSWDAHELWKTLKRTTVEPCHSSPPEFVSFADECLLCAQIVLNEEHATDAFDGEDGMETYDIADGASPPQSSLATRSPEYQRAGFIYLHSGPANLPASEANVGVIIKRDMQGRGYAREAVQLILRWAFEELKFHRVQAAILDTPFKDRALRLFIGSGFLHEGTRRRAIYQSGEDGVAGVWKDVTYLAMLDTEWVLRSALKQDDCSLAQPVISVWDEMFARHSREQEELVRWEEKCGRLRRSSSTETLKENGWSTEQDLGYLTDDLSSITEQSLGDSSPRLDVVVNWEEDAQMADSPRAHETDQQGWEQVVEKSRAAQQHTQGRMGDSFLEPSPRGPTLALPSIPSTTGRFSDGSPQSPITIPSPTSSVTPPSSSSSSPVPSSVHSRWSDSEDEDNLLPRDDLAAAPIQHLQPNMANLKMRSRTSSVSSSADSWSDAQSSVCASWDVISDASGCSHHGP